MEIDPLIFRLSIFILSIFVGCGPTPPPKPKVPEKPPEPPKPKLINGHIPIEANDQFHLLVQARTASINTYHIFCRV